MLKALLEAGDGDGVVATMLHEVAELPPETVEHIRSLPAWQARVAAAHTIPREVRTPEAFQFDPERFAALRVPMLLLIGGDSKASFEETEKALSKALPDRRIVIMPGQGHAAMNTATDLFTTEVLRFLEGP